MIKKQFKIVAVTGFAHPACLIVSDASKFTSTISLIHRGVSVNLKNPPNSIMELISLRIKPGTFVEITANGCDEHAALHTIENSLSKNLYIEPEKRGNSWTVSNYSFCDEIVF
ncbi:phosphocarrier protein [Peribacillus deserti]|uniref:Phosphocarrier protein n=1 Tax=Peribacillus deserti TaxID=673318 RepID=A0ABS2QNK5_9BACI|nr:phosphocarrier protein [Peribacillus deserti]